MSTKQGKPRTKSARQKRRQQLKQIRYLKVLKLTRAKLYMLGFEDGRPDNMYHSAYKHLTLIPTYLHCWQIKNPTTEAYVGVDKHRKFFVVWASSHGARVFVAACKEYTKRWGRRGQQIISHGNENSPHSSSLRYIKPGDIQNVLAVMIEWDLFYGE